MTKRLLSAAACAVVAASLAANTAAGTSVTPFKNNKWRANQVVPFTWKSDARPPAWMRPAALDASDDAGSTTSADAATFALADIAASWIGYTEDVCTDAAIGCAYSNAPTSFTVRIRPQGWTFDWGTLRWCQFYDSPPDGCFDAEMITLHELGHVQGLGHIDDAPDPGAPSDWLDSVMHSVSHAKPKLGWAAHSFGRCDVAALQAAYQPSTSTTRLSPCLSLATVASLSAPASVPYGATVRFVATLAIAPDVAYPQLRGFPLSSRQVTLQRRSAGSSTWLTVTQMTPTGSDGQYSYSQSVTTMSDWRAVFAAPSTEGLLGDASDSARVVVGDCMWACPLSAPRSLGGGQ